MTGVADTIANIANDKGIDPYLAIATAFHESQLNPQAIGDNGSSYGIFQLHRGGELPASWEAQQAFDPAANANVALGVFANTAAANPGLSGGQLAAAAQRPANAGAYATAVDDIYRSLIEIHQTHPTYTYDDVVKAYSNDYRSQYTGSSAGTQPVSDTKSTGNPLLDIIINALKGPVATSNAVNNLVTNAFLPSTYIRATAGIIGIILIFTGIVLIVKDYNRHE